MIDEIKKSISATLYERTTSPLFGTFFFSWSVWNWKIIIALLFTTAEELKMTKFEYIDINLLNVYDGLIYPIISTIIILTLYAWVSEQAYRLWLYFDRRKNEHKNTIEKQKFLTKEQSMKLRLELSKQEDSFENLIKDKEELITALKNEISELQSKFNSSDNIISGSENILKEVKSLEKFFNNENAVAHFEEVAKYVNHGWTFDSEKIPDSITSYFIALELIQDTSRNGAFEFTDKGKEYLKEYFDRKN